MVLVIGYIAECNTVVQEVEEEEDPRLVQDERITCTRRTAVNYKHRGGRNIRGAVLALSSLVYTV